MCCPSDIPDGPSVLETLADQLAGQSRDFEAQQIRGLQKAWAADQKRIEALETENTTLQSRLIAVRCAMEDQTRRTG